MELVCTHYLLGGAEQVKGKQPPEFLLDNADDLIDVLPGFRHLYGI